MPKRGHFVALLVLKEREVIRRERRGSEIDKENDDEREMGDKRCRGRKMRSKGGCQGSGTRSISLAW